MIMTNKQQQKLVTMASILTEDKRAHLAEAILNMAFDRNNICLAFEAVAEMDDKTLNALAKIVQQEQAARA